ncbi:MAG: type II secretion system protein GspE [Luteitalea sp.]|nr:type II secretion system protein GspE [Luteitalea sp.]
MTTSLSRLLVDAGTISKAELEIAERHQALQGGSLDACLITLNLATEAEVAHALSCHYGVPGVDTARIVPSAEVLARVPASVAHGRRLLPLNHCGQTLTVAMADPSDLAALDELRFLSGDRVDAVVAPERAIGEALHAYYPASVPLEQATRALEQEPMPPGHEIQAPRAAVELSAVPGQRDEAPIVALVNELLRAAAQRGASDVHIEPGERDVGVRFRIDGVLHPVMALPLRVRDALIARIKILAELDIAERRLPQDGRIKLRLGRAVSGPMDVRVSSLPALYGEKLVLRLLDREQLRLDFRALGFEPSVQAAFEAAVARPWGMVLVTGPTGSGKTNTLYSAIAQLDTTHRNVLTVEDPVEIHLSGITQVQVHEAIGLGFAAVLRAFLRQDPDVLLVGEIRDVETAQIAVRAALTGHLVLSTLHTTDAAAAVMRLVDMGIEPFLVAGAVSLVCAQRLVRRVCPVCRGPRSLPLHVLRSLGFGAEEVATLTPVSGTGCVRCHQSGYRGRIGLFEVMCMTESVRELMLTRAPLHRLRAQAIHEGMQTLRQSGLQKVRDGLTTIEEVVRETS